MGVCTDHFRTSVSPILDVKLATVRADLLTKRRNRNIVNAPSRTMLSYSRVVSLGTIFSAGIHGFSYTALVLCLFYVFFPSLF